MFICCYLCNVSDDLVRVQLPVTARVVFSEVLLTEECVLALNIGIRADMNLHRHHTALQNSL